MFLTHLQFVEPI